MLRVLAAGHFPGSSFNLLQRAECGQLPMQRVVWDLISGELGGV
jgi:hypothetical protein